MMDPLTQAIAAVPPGKWAVAVSGGADSVALLSLLRTRSDLALHIVHLDHRTRGAASTGDAEFVRQLAVQWGLVCTVARRDQIEPQMSLLPSNASARFRAVRFELFRRVVASNDLRGVILAHHADDQAETVLLRLARGSTWAGLCGMEGETLMGDLRILRPLLGASREDLRRCLASMGQAWREDASNQSNRYTRNRLRPFLAGHPELRAALLTLAEACQHLRRWTRQAAPKLPQTFAAAQLVDLPSLLTHESVRQWLIARGAAAGELSEVVLDGLINMAADAASAPRRHFPGGLLVRRRAGYLIAEPSPA